MEIIATDKPDKSDEIEKEIADLQWNLDNRLEEVAEITLELDNLKKQL